LWRAAPLITGCRSLGAWSPRDRSLITTHYLPLARQTVRRHGAALSYSLPRDEFDSQAAEWLVRALTRYDPARGVPFAAYLRTKIHHWVIDLARAGGSGRAVNDTETAISRARDHVAGRTGRDARRFPGTLLAKRGAPREENLRAVEVRRRLRHADPLDDVELATISVQPERGVWTVGHPEDEGEPDRALLAREEQRLATSALAHSAWKGDETLGGDNVAGLVAFVLIELDGHTKTDVAKAGRQRVASVAASLNALVHGARTRLGSAAR
jgi:hypothetical protein